MKTILITLSIALGCLLNSKIIHCQDFKKIDQYLLKAQELSQEQKLLETAQMYEKAVIEEKSGPNTRDPYLGQELYYAGYFFSAAGEYRKAIGYFDESYEIYKKINPEGLISILNQTALAHFFLKEVEKANSVLETALNQAKSKGKKDVIAAQFHYIGEKNQEFGHYSRAIEAFDKAAAAFQELGNIPAVALEMNNIGVCYKESGDPVNANVFYKKSHTLLQTHQNKELLAAVLYNIGEVKAEASQLDITIQYYTQSMNLYKELNNVQQQAFVANQLGVIYQQKQEFQSALDFLEQSKALYRSLKKHELEAVVQGNIGRAYLYLKNYPEAEKQILSAATKLEGFDNFEAVYLNLSNLIKLYKTTQELDKEEQSLFRIIKAATVLGKFSEISTFYNNLGEVYRKKGRNDQAIEFFQTALNNTPKSDHRSRATVLNNRGLSFKALGGYDKAIESLNIALKEMEEAKQKKDASFILNNVGMVYLEWGAYDKALDHFTKAMKLDKKSGKKRLIPIRLNNIGMVHIQRKKYQKALDIYQQALKIKSEDQDRATLVSIYSNQGLTYYYTQQYDKAKESFDRAFQLAGKIGLKKNLAVLLNNIGLVYFDTEDLVEAAKYFQKSLNVATEQKNQPSIALALDNLGILYYKMYNDDIAPYYLQRSIDLKEKLRLTASGDERRDYLASQIHSYQYLTSSYLRSNQLQKAFKTIELSRTKQLAERLGLDPQTDSLPNLVSSAGELPDDTAVLVFGNVSPVMEHLAILGFNQKVARGYETEKQPYLSHIVADHKQAVASSLAGTRGIKLIKKKIDTQNSIQAKIEVENIDLEKIIVLYRDLLTNSDEMEEEEWAKNKESIKKISKKLYDFFIGPAEEIIEGKKQLIIIPDGILAFLPFETLINQKGKYLVEEYDIRYIQSMNVMNLVNGRNYAMKKKPLIAFGGPVYEKTSNTNSDDHVDASKIYGSIEKRASMLNAYAALGIGGWSALPGTLEETKKIHQLFKKSILYTGEDASEQKVKNLFSKPSAPYFGVIHFATHALAVPSIPELSALVLSQKKRNNKIEDGYLRIGEIVNLHMKSDFVNLSACETGLGKVYQGEGVVGLTQSFMIAGSNAVSVSLWQVSDHSTSQFMVSLYEEVQKNGLNYVQSINKIKRQFIKGNFGEEYQSPYYWAPFIYYGR